MRLAIPFALLFATSLWAATSPAQEPQEASKALIEKVTDGYVFHFSAGESEGGVSVHDFVLATAWGADRLIFWDEETDRLLRKRRVRIRGQETVREDRLVQFLQATLLRADLLCIEHGPAYAKVIQIIPLADEKSSSSRGDGLVSIEGDSYVFDFGAPRADESTTLLEFASLCAQVSDLQFTWNLATEDLLKERRVRLRGKRSVPKNQLSSFIEVMMAVGDFSTTTIGEGDVSLMMIQSFAEARAAAAAVELPNYTPRLREPTVLTFGASSIAESVALLDLCWICQRTTGKILIYNNATDERLTDQRVRLVGTKALQRDAFLALFKSILTASSYSWEVVTTAAGSRIKIESL